MRKRLRGWRVGAALFVVAAVARGQVGPSGVGAGPLTNPAPFAPAPAAVSPGALSTALAAAERAHDLGFLSTAAGAYRELLDAPGADKVGLTLALATVLLDGDQPLEAEKLLASVPEPHTAAWRLRAGMAALRLRKRPAAQAQWDVIKAEEISDRDRPWYNFFTGALYDTATPRDVQRANTFYVNAERGATTELARARFQLAAERVRLRETVAPTKESLDVVKSIFDQLQGREASYEPARQYAVLLALQGRRDDAVKFLRENVLLGMPAQERAWRDEFNFMIGLLADQSRTGAGRNALMELVAKGTKAQRQRQALQILANASPRDPERAQLREELNRLIAATPPHPLRETLLYFRAQLALAEKDYAMAEEAANRLLRDFPASPLRLHAFGVLTQSAWEQHRYRAAAASARSARQALPAVQAGQPDGAAAARGDLGVLEAEAYFRMGEFRNAADAYAAVLREPGAKTERASGLIFQRVLAEIQAGAATATAIIDEYATNPAFTLDDRWQAEWSLARQLQVQGKTDEAYTRVGQLLSAQRAEDARFAELKPDLRARMTWLHARLAFDSDRFEPALQQVEVLMRSLEGVEPKLRAEIASAALLLRGQTELAMKREAPALETLKRLRDEFPKTEAAIQSYLTQADYYEQQEKIPQAQQQLVAIVDNPAYAASDQKPDALYRLALLSEKLGQDKDLEEANKRLEQLVSMDATKLPVDLTFMARLKQGDIFRRRGDFPAAQRAYEELVNNHGQRPDVVIAQLRLADCRSALVATDPPGTSAHAAAAQSLYEQLRDRVDAPADVRVEAGYKLGNLLAQRGQHAKAAQVWWNDVIDPFLKENKEPFSPMDKRPYWLAKTLMDYAKLQEDQERPDEAKKAYRLVLQTKLEIAEPSAREALKRLGEREARL
ncbi:MAG: tetratricopeptide repeat protein [Verrucomicrobiota bacterium]